VIVAVVTGLLLLTVFFSKIPTVRMHHTSKNERMAVLPHTSSNLRSNPHGGHKSTATLAASGSNNKAGYFASMEAEFAWNQYKVPGYTNYQTNDRNTRFERKTDSGRRFLEQLNDPRLRYENLRGPRNGD